MLYSYWTALPYRPTLCNCG